MAQELSIQKDEKQITYTFVGTPKFMAKQGYSLYLLLIVASTIGGCTVGAGTGTFIGETATLIGAGAGLIGGFFLMKMLSKKMFNKTSSFQVRFDEAIILNNGDRIPLKEMHSVNVEHVQKGGDAEKTNMRTALVFAMLNDGRRIQLTDIMVSQQTANRIFNDLTN